MIYWRLRTKDSPTKPMKLTRFVLGAILFSLAALCTVEAFREAAHAHQQQQEIKIDPKTFDQFVGQYALNDNPDVVYSFYREGDKFFMRPSHQKGTEIFPGSETKFFLKVVDFDFTFIRDAQNKVTGLVWHQGNDQRSMNKIYDQPLSDKTVPFDL